MYTFEEFYFHIYYSVYDSIKNPQYLILWFVNMDIAIIIYSPKKEMQHVKKYNLLQIFNIILNTEISITLHWNLHTGCSDFKVH
jgi:hypothetical protein